MVNPRYVIFAYMQIILMTHLIYQVDIDPSPVHGWLYIRGKMDTHEKGVRHWHVHSYTYPLYSNKLCLLLVHCNVYVKASVEYSLQNYELDTYLFFSENPFFYYLSVLSRFNVPTKFSKLCCTSTACRLNHFFLHKAKQIFRITGNILTFQPQVRNKPNIISYQILSCICCICNFLRCS